MEKYERTTSFRFPEDIYNKIDILYEYYAKEAKRIGGKEKTRTEIMQDAVNELYYKMINHTQDADVVGRISHTIDDKVNASMNNLHGKIDQILYLVNKLDLGTKVLYRSPSVMPAPKDVDQAIRIITNEESKWYNAIEEIMMSNIKKKDEGEE